MSRRGFSGWAITFVLVCGFLTYSSPAFASQCMALWIERNSLIDGEGYCFGSKLGQAVFDNSDCFTKTPLLSDLQKAKVREIQRQEKALNCEPQKKQWRPDDVAAIYRLLVGTSSSTTAQAETLPQTNKVEQTERFNTASENALENDKELVFASPKEQASSMPAATGVHEQARTRRQHLADFRQLSGVWVGEISCTGGHASYAARMTIGKDAPITGRVAMTIGATTQDGSQDIYTGSLLYDVRFQAPSGDVVLRPVSWLKTAKHKAFERSISIEIGTGGKSIHGDMTVGRQNVACTNLYLTKTQESPSQIAELDGDSLSWFGELNCDDVYRTARLQSPKFLISMNIRTPKKRELYAVLNVMTEYGGGRLEAGGTKFIGERSRRDETVLSFVEQNGYRLGLKKPPLKSFEFDTKTEQFSSMKDECEFVQMRTTESILDLHAVTHEIPLPAPYYSAETDRDRCELLIEWADKIDAEFPNINFGRSTDVKDTWRLALPLADDDYVALFGIAFDRMDDKAHDEIWHQMGKCKREPFTRDRSSNIHRILSQTASGNLEEKYMVQQIRMLRNAARVQEAGVRIDQLKSISATLSEFPERLWPSEYEAVKNSIVTKAANSCFEIEQVGTNEAGERTTNTINTCDAETPSAVKQTPAAVEQESQPETEIERQKPSSVLIVPVLPKGN